MVATFVIIGLIVAVLVVDFTLFGPKGLTYPLVQKYLQKKSNSPVQKKWRPYSDAAKEGYADMAWALSRHKSYSSYSSVFSGYTTYDLDDSYHYARFSDHRIERLGDDAKLLRSFDPQKGRSSEKYMSGTPAEFSEYYRGGMQLLSDVDDMQVRVAERKRLIEQRKEGLKPLDKQYVASKIELDQLRDKTFANLTDHQKFENEMKEIGS